MGILSIKQIIEKIGGFRNNKTRKQKGAIYVNWLDPLTFVVLPVFYIYGFCN